MEEMDSSGQKKGGYEENKDIAGFGNLLDLDEDNTTPTHHTEAHSNASTTGSGIDELLSLGNPAPASKSISDPLAELMGGMSSAPPQKVAGHDDLLGMFGSPSPPPVVSEYC